MPYLRLDGMQLGSGDDSHLEVSRALQRCISVTKSSPQGHTNESAGATS